MSRQNIYDQPDFFAGYQQIRQRQDNANDLIETPTLMQLLPDLTDKRLLDLGCGAGDHCQLFIERGAAHVLGVDLSEKMLALAQHQHAHPAIRYQRLAIEDISSYRGLSMWWSVLWPSIMWPTTLRWWQTSTNC